MGFRQYVRLCIAQIIFFWISIFIYCLHQLVPYLSHCIYQMSVPYHCLKQTWIKPIIILVAIVPAVFIIAAVVPCVIVVVVLMTSWSLSKYDDVLNPLRPSFFIGNINMYLQLISLLHIDTPQVVEILPYVRKELTYSTIMGAGTLVTQGARASSTMISTYWPEIIRSPHIKILSVKQVSGESVRAKYNNTSTIRSFVCWSPWINVCG